MKCIKDIYNKIVKKSTLVFKSAKLIKGLFILTFPILASIDQSTTIVVISMKTLKLVSLKIPCTVQ